VNNPELTEQRRTALDDYVNAIESAKDGKWREANEWRAFLAFPPVDSRRNSEQADGSLLPQAMTPSTWLDLHANLKTQLQESRSHLARREAPGTSTTAQHDASAAAKRCLVKSNTLILRLEEGLKTLPVGDGEIRRRRDLLGRARKEREGLDRLLNAWVLNRTNAALNTPADPRPIGALDVRKQDLFEGSSSPKMPGSFPTSGRRVLGGPAKETERTRDKDNSEVLQLQQQIMQEQDMDVDDLAKAVRRLKELGVAINEELIEQGPMLDIIDQDVDRVGGKIGIAKKRIRKLG